MLKSAICCGGEAPSRKGQGFAGREKAYGRMPKLPDRGRPRDQVPGSPEPRLQQASLLDTGRGELAQEIFLVRDREFCRAGGRGRPAVRGEIGQRGVRFVTHARHDGDARVMNGADGRLLVERPEVLQRPAAACHDQHVGALGMVGGKPVEGGNGFDYLTGRVIALHHHGLDDDVRHGISSFQDSQNIPDGCATSGGHHAYPIRERGDGALPGGIEESLGRKPAAQFCEGLLQGAFAGGGHGPYGNLDVASGWVHAETSADPDLQTIRRPEAESLDIGLPHHAAHLPFGVLQREVEMPGSGAAQVGEFALEKERTELRFQAALEAVDKGANLFWSLLRIPGSGLHVSFAHTKRERTMGKGDKRSRRGKITNKSYGKSRPRKSTKKNAKKA